MVGTRPEAIKMIPVYKQLKKHSDTILPLLVSTGQHKEMLRQVFSDFDVIPDIDLNIMTQNQTLAGMSSKLFLTIDSLLEIQKPNVVLVQGDTTTVQVASLCAFYQRIPIGHIEAGLRSHDLNLPFPEELNRRVTGIIATWHFPPTDLSKNNLINEGITAEKICVSGNTVIDALLYIQQKVRRSAPPMPSIIEKVIEEKRRIILVTGHRRESIGSGFEDICEALKQLSLKYPNDRIIYPVHLNPLVRKTVLEKLKNIEGILLIDPLPYKQFVYLMDKCSLIMTDSGGIQEEGPSMGKPVLIMREVTERPEGINAGVNFLVGTNSTDIIKYASNFLDEEDRCRLIGSIQNPYGDGKASERIVSFLMNKLKVF